MVDNASTDGTQDELTQMSNDKSQIHNSNLKIIQNKKLGFCKGK